MGMEPVNMTKEGLAATLRFMAERMAEGDSFDGYIEYHLSEDKEYPFEVTAAIRYGNTLGQGFMRVIGDYVKEAPGEGPEV